MHQFRVLEDSKKCPVCAEIIKLEAIKCRFCGEKFDPDDVSKQVAAIKSKDSFKDRALCSDGSCIGIIGSDGKCGVCGKPYKQNIAPAQTVKQAYKKPGMGILIGLVIVGLIVWFAVTSPKSPDSKMAEQAKKDSIIPSKASQLDQRTLLNQWWTRHKVGTVDPKDKNGEMKYQIAVNWLYYRKLMMVSLAEGDNDSFRYAQMQFKDTTDTLNAFSSEKVNKILSQLASELEIEIPNPLR